MLFRESRRPLARIDNNAGVRCLRATRPGRMFTLHGNLASDVNLLVTGDEYVSPVLRREPAAIATHPPLDESNVNENVVGGRSTRWPSFVPTVTRALIWWTAPAHCRTALRPEDQDNREHCIRTRHDRAGPHSCRSAADRIVASQARNDAAAERHGIARVHDRHFMMKLAPAHPGFSDQATRQTGIRTGRIGESTVKRALHERTLMKSHQRVQP